MGQPLDRARTPGHTRGRDLCPRRTGEPGALADERASTETRVRESDDSRRSRAGATRRIRPRNVDCERFRIDSRARQPMVRPRANVGAVGTVRGVAVRIERAVQSTPRRLSANRGGPADIRSRGPPPDALIVTQAATHTTVFDVRAFRRVGRFVMYRSASGASTERQDPTDARLGHRRQHRHATSGATAPRRMRRVHERPHLRAGARPRARLHPLPVHRTAAGAADHPLGHPIPARKRSPGKPGRTHRRPGDCTRRALVPGCKDRRPAGR